MTLLSFNKKIIQSALLSATLMVAPIASMAADYMPFVLGSTVSSGSLSSVVNDSKAALEKNGFKVVGSYSPNSGVEVLVVTNPALKAMASKSKHGGFGAMERISISQKNGQVEVSYTNPSYLWNVYRMKGDIAPIQTAMESALGAQKEFGADEGISGDDLREYHYKMMMPYFDDEVELAEYDSHAEAIAAVEAGLKAHRGGAKKVYRIDIPGKKMSVFGVALDYKGASDKIISHAIDNKTNSHAAHFPYEILVVDDEVIALDGKFRIAINWPHLSMMGAGSFMSISNAPDDITEALEAVAKNEKIEAESDSDL
ncbi:MAG: hypothetical protein GXO35_02075 [Gammaproteobacteria bacterium]|nr:hypothetical protein [Gammaproteobacteria bacterium]